MEATVQKIVSDIMNPRPPTLQTSMSKFNSLVAQRSLSNTQVSRILSAILTHYDTSKIADCPRDLSGESFSFTCALLFVQPILAITRHYISHDLEYPPAVLVVELVEIWPSLLQWLWCFVTHAEAPSWKIAARRAIMDAIILTTEIYIKVRHLWEGINDAPCTAELIPIALRLWTLEHADPRLHFESLPDGITHTSSAEMLNTCLDAFKIYDKRVLDGIFAAPEAQKAEQMVAVTLGNLQKNSRRGLPAYSADIAVLVHLSDYPSLNRLLLNHGSVAEITAISRIHAHHAYTKGAFKGYTSDIECCLFYVLNAFAEGNGFTWAIQTLRCGIIETMMYHSFLCEADTGFDILLSILPTYFVYELVAIAAGRALLKSWSRVDLKYKDQHKDRWKEFVGHVHRASAISGRLSGDQKFLRQPGCSFEDCDREVPKLGRCSGCMHSYYCSRRHQKADWKHRHRDYCQTVRSFPEGFASVISSRDVYFSCLHARSILQFHEVQITEFMDNYSLRKVQVIFDFSMGRSGSFQLGDPRSHPIPPNVARDSELLRKWSILVNEPDDDLPRRRALVCASIPMGRDQKVLIGAANVHEPMTLRLFD